MALIKRYKADELATCPQMLAELTLAMEPDPADVLGRTFHDLELHNKWSGQFFSPYPLCRMMAKMTLGDEEDVRARIAVRGFVTAQEPACGSGAMVIALAQGMKDLGINYQQHLHVTAVDVDPKCVHMAYVQFALLHSRRILAFGLSARRNFVLQHLKSSKSNSRFQYDYWRAKVFNDPANPFNWQLTLRTKNNLPKDQLLGE
jgi:hypothetical protein